MTPLRLALFSGNYNYVRDGANRALNRLVGYLEEEAGVVVRVYSPTTSTPAFAPTGTLITVPSLPFPGRPEYRVALRLPQSIKRDLEAFAPNLVHLSAPDLLGRHALGWAEARGLPVVASLHTRFETYFGYYGLGWTRRWAERYLHGFYARCDRVLAPTPAIVQGMTAQLGPGRVSLWSRGVDREVFSPAWRDPAARARSGFSPDDVVITFFGRLVVEKGTDMFGRAITALRERGVPVRVLVIGDGPARAAMTEALPGASFAGMLSGDALSTALAGADILVSPSVTEAFGNVVLESMASGVVPVCAEVASALNLVADGENGFLCEPGNPAAYADAVATLVNDGARLAAMKRAARDASARFTWSAALRSVVATYAEVLGVGVALPSRGGFETHDDASVLREQGTRR